ncbi:carbohydrate ABC transporter permease [Alicyclobacillus sp. SO9]|uniref:carbohydrate ABC transporter permease n=1 Tax=Alicyclobacillus sp. SO9 TaxID=2665646 RepID=UPI0018E7C270|nr:carbohydrate ABC transporter permease [Alicyclobacillus sp. SO9]QQE80244.1 carbohydrate ABC transporter permease [Alicyclobacillus sp. SO9]
MREHRLNHVGSYAVLTVFTLFFALPIYWTVISAFKPLQELFTWPPLLWPNHFTIKNFIVVLRSTDFVRYFLNSTFVTITSTIITLFLSLTSGYALAKFKFRGSTFILILILGTIMFPLEVIMIPMFQVLKDLHLYNSLWGIIIPPAATPTGVFLMRQYLLSIPNDLLEAARIDGASEWWIFLRIITPLAKPAIAVLAIFSFMWRWNDYLWPLLVISNPHKYTLGLAIANYAGEFSVNWTSLLAMTVITMIPVIVVFLSLQRFIVKGLFLSGMK